MLRNRPSREQWIILALLAALTGCNLPQTRTTPTLDGTLAYQTLAAQVTQGAFATTAVSMFPTPLPLTLVPSAQVLPTSTPLPPPPTPACNRASAGNPIDVTVPDDTVLQPGEAFTKKWRLVNTGNCTWSTTYALVWFSGERLGAPVESNLRGAVGPGQIVDLSVDMTAPSSEGTYQSNWKLRDGSGVFFGIGPLGDSPFWVRIIVAVTPSATPTPTPTLTPTPSPSSTPTPTST